MNQGIDSALDSATVERVRPSQGAYRSSNTFQVAIIDSTKGSYLQEPDIEQQILGPDAAALLYRVNSAEQLLGRVEDADAIISWHTIPLDSNIIKRLRCCRGIVRAAVGFDNIDVAAAAEKGIPVCIVPDYGTEEVADHTMALVLALIRKLGRLDKHVRGGGWDWRTIGSVMRLRGTAFGIVGLGRIGSAVARRAQTFGFDVSFYDPYVPTGMDKVYGLIRCNILHELLKRSRIISLHVPLTNETRHLIGRQELQCMTSETILINTSRGDVIDQQALIESIAAGKIGSIGLDVLSNEPCIPQELLGHDSSILTAHSAFYSDASLAELRRKAAVAARRFLFNQPPVDIVNGIFRMSSPPM